ncbi:hypothetical protein H6P81_017289 [Aristolochia fimbriata]|uniref:Uncharacterized protein n=1 Tax=Aristolochia fimbriata TaxID=158543 RepID=A0AAV7DXR4_ARIFI|nr:hypothetical protein H6P81_017289 [Aristolochia fimbriata]
MKVEAPLSQRSQSDESSLVKGNESENPPAFRLFLFSPNHTCRHLASTTSFPPRPPFPRRRDVAHRDTCVAQSCSSTAALASLYVAPLRRPLQAPHSCPPNSLSALSLSQSFVPQHVARRGRASAAGRRLSGHVVGAGNLEGGVRGTRGGVALNFGSVSPSFRRTESR